MYFERQADICNFEEGMARRVAYVLVRLRTVGVAVVLKVMHRERVDGQDGLLRESKYLRELGLFA